jgi:hypothetical protein
MDLQFMPWRLLQNPFGVFARENYAHNLLVQPAGGLINCHAYEPYCLTVYRRFQDKRFSLHTGGLMQHTTRIITASACLGLALFSGCATLDGHEGAVVGTAVGVAGGAAVGSAVAGKGNRGTGAVVGAVIGGVAGGVAGSQLHDKK